MRVANQTWRDYSPATINELARDAYLLSDEGFAYVLPALLTASLGDSELSNSAIQAVITGLIPCGLPVHTIGALNRAQRLVLFEWFDWVADELRRRWEDYYPFAHGREAGLKIELEQNLSDYATQVEKWRRQAVL